MKEKADYNFLIEKFGEDVIKSHYDHMEKRALAFITECHLDDIIILNHELLNVVILDYFTDIERLKSFEGIVRINKNKITAFTSYWWLRRKPLQIATDMVGNEELAYINEKFITVFLSKDFLYDDNRKNSIDNEICEKCLNHIYYHLKYRIYTPQTLELFLMGIGTGKEIIKI